MKTYQWLLVLALMQLTPLMFSAALASPAAPTNLVVTGMIDAQGKYFHITFKKLSVPADSAFKYTYQICRWAGAPPDTIDATTPTFVMQGTDSVGVYDDHDYMFNLSPADSVFRSTFSYSVCTHYWDTTKGRTVLLSPWLTPVVVHLDTVAVAFTHTPSSSNTVHFGDTVHGTFSATANNGAAVRYRMSTHNGPATYGLDSITGNFWACCADRTTLLPSQSSFTILATDNAGHTALASINMIVVPMQDTVVVSFFDSGNNPLPQGTRCYYGLLPPRPQDSTARAQYLTTLLDARGKATIVCDSGQFNLRLQVEGFVPVWLIDSNGDTVIRASRNANVKLQTAATHSITGRVGGVKDSAISGATVSIYRTMSYSDYLYAKFVDSVHTNASGMFNIQVSAGDSVLQTNYVYVLASAEGYNGSPEWYVQKVYKTPLAITSNENHDSINFAFPIRDYTPPEKATIMMSFPGLSDTNAQVMVVVYDIADSTHSHPMVDTVRNRDDYIFLPVGNFILFAQPLDTGYVGGYYRHSGYAATWQDADTFGFTSVHFLYSVAIVVKRDSSSNHGGTGGTPIAGIVTEDSIRIGLAHLLLYKIVGAPAGSSFTSTFVTATLTDRYGQYSFSHLAAGTYELDLDIVGKPLLKIGGIIVDGSSTVVTKDIVVNPTAVDQRAITVLPSQIVLGQNYPNPVSGIARFEIQGNVPDDATRSSLRFSVYDILGREITTPSSLSINKTEIVFDARALRAGMYFLKGRIGQVEFSRAFVVRN